MKVLDLGCAHGHVFEGWFASEDDFCQQQARGLIECPLCGNQQVDKRLSAPRLNLGKAEAPAAPAVPPSPRQGPARASDGPPGPAAWVQALREAVRRSEDVGPRFAEEARRIHEGQAPARPIRGQSTWDEAAALVEDGIEVLPLPDLPLLKQTLQ
jgi:hypothetical protein